MGTYGGLRGPMGSYGGLWGPLGTYGSLWGPIGAYGGLWGPMGAYGDLWGPMGAYGDLCGPMGTYGVLWGPMGAYGGLLARVGARGGLWGPMGTFGDLWGPMRTYGGLWRSMYLPWCSNNPRSHKLGWIKGECARYLRTNSHKCYFDLVCDRLRSCLIRLHYPKSTYEPLPLSWSSKSLYMHRKPRATMHTPIHCLRVPFHASLEFSLTGLLQWMQRKLATHIPRLRLFVTYRPMTKLRIVWHRLAMSTLRESGEGGRDGTVFLPRDLGSKNSLTPDLTAQDLLQA